eukprot:g28139.t1
MLRRCRRRWLLPLAVAIAGLGSCSFVSGCPNRRRDAPCGIFRRAVKDPWSVLELERGASRDEVKRAFREKIRRAHPDAGGSAQEFNEVREAYQAALMEAGHSRRATKDFYKWRREQVQQQKVEWEKDADFRQQHWWTSAEQRRQQKQQAQTMDEEQVRVQAAGRARSPRSGARNAQSTQAAARSRTRVRSPQGREDDSVREWKDFLSGRDQPKPEKTSAQRALERSQRIRDPVVTHRSIATAGGDVRMPVFRAPSGRCYYVSPLTNREVTVPL